MKRALTLSLALLVCALPVWAQESCEPLDDEQSLSEYLNGYSACIEGRLRGDAEPNSLAASTERITKETLSAQPAATSAASGFGSRVRDSIEDFLPLFSFAVDSVSTSDNDRSATLRLAPLRGARWGSLAFTLTASEPTPGEALLQEAPEGTKERLKELAGAELDDFSDLAFGAKWGFEPTADADSRWLLGRSYNRYDGFIEDLLLPALSRGRLSSEQAKAISNRIQGCEEALELKTGVESVETLPMGRVRKELDTDYDACLDAMKAEEADVVRFDARLDKLALLPYLIDNQPQLVVTGAWHRRDPIVGRDGWELKVAFEKGFENFNSILRRYHEKRERPGFDLNDAAALSTAFWEAVDELDEQQVEAGNKLTFSAAYAERERHVLGRTFGTGDSAIPISIDAGRADEWSYKVEYHRNATWHPISLGTAKVYPSFNLSVEYADVSDDPARQDRLIAVATYEIPLSSGTSIPLSLTYANHSEFLGEPDEALSAHFGLSYKLPLKP